MAELPTEAMCRSKDHTFIEHEVFYEYGQKEGDFMKEHGIITENQWQIIKDMTYARKAELTLIYDRDVHKTSADGRDFIDSVAREVVCNCMSGLEGKTVPYQLEILCDDSE